jgi:(p)ppGpp synthase/HD superfamily hydrolase
MSDAVGQATLDLLNAVSFAARAHCHQLRKDGQTPYASHPFRVCLIVRQVFGIDDPKVLTAALLHDTIEDTTTDFDDLAEQFSPEVARWAADLSKDKRLPDDEREHAYLQRLAAAEWPVKLCKLADVFDNLVDSAHFPPEKRRKTIERARSYLSALRSHLPEMARRPFEIVSRLLLEMTNAQ